MRELRKQLAELLTGWPVGEPCQCISDEEAAELAEFIARSIDPRGTAARDRDSNGDAAVGR